MELDMEYTETEILQLNRNGWGREMRKKVEVVDNEAERECKEGKNKNC